MPGGFRQLRDEDIEEYVLFRQRLDEFLHLFTAWSHYREKPRSDPEWPVNLTLHIALHVWLYSFFDPKGLDVRSLWRRVFPWLKPKLEAWRREFQPRLDLLEEFRHVTGAHVNRRIDEHNRVRTALSEGVEGKSGGGGREALELFVTMARDVTKQEQRRPELVETLARYQLKPGI